MRKNEANAPFCTTQEAAELLGVARRTAQLWVESGLLRAWKTGGGHRRIARSSVETLLKDRSAVASGTPRTDRFRILVVEDEEALLKLYQMQIEGWSLPVELHTATNGFEGLIQIGEIHPHLLITDLNMPGMDGFRMIRSLRAKPAFRDLRIVAVTALGLRDITDRGGLPPDVRIFTKPVPFSELLSLVRGECEKLQLPLGESKPAPRKPAVRKPATPKPAGT